MPDLRFFDCNCMFGKAEHEMASSFSSTGQLTAEMDSMGIEETLVFASYAKYNRPDYGNAFLSECIKGEKRFHACYAITPEMQFERGFPDSFVAKANENNVEAVRIFPSFNCYAPEPWILQGFMEIFSRVKTPVLVDSCIAHWNDDYDWSPVYRLCGAYPDVPVIAVRHAMRAARSIYPLLSKFTNIYLETSYFQLNRGLKDVASKFGSERLIFGTGLPLYDPRLPLAGLLYSGLTDTEKVGVSGDNLRALLSRVDWSAA